MRKQTFETIEEIKSEAIESFKLGITYFDGILEDYSIEDEILDIEFKIRMNKDHARNRKNDDDTIHNLSLINRKGESYDEKNSWTDKGGRVSSQIWNITSLEEFENELDNFLNEVIELEKEKIA